MQQPQVRNPSQSWKVVADTALSSWRGKYLTDIGCKAIALPKKEKDEGERCQSKPRLNLGNSKFPFCPKQSKALSTKLLVLARALPWHCSCWSRYFLCDNVTLIQAHKQPAQQGLGMDQAQVMCQCTPGTPAGDRSPGELRAPE